MVEPLRFPQRKPESMEETPIEAEKRLQGEADALEMKIRAEKRRADAEFNATNDPERKKTLQVRLDLIGEAENAFFDVRRVLSAQNQNDEERKSLQLNDIANCERYLRNARDFLIGKSADVIPFRKEA